jgi:hypothetical protein
MIIRCLQCISFDYESIPFICSLVCYDYNLDSCANGINIIKIYVDHGFNLLTNRCIAS